jgi:uncharacterized protein
MKLQRNTATGALQYPPGPALAGEQEWVPISGQGTILSWVVFHRQYLPAYPPYNAIAVQLLEGTIMISNLRGPAPEGSRIGRSVRLIYVDMPDGVIPPRFELAAETQALPRCALRDRRLAAWQSFRCRRSAGLRDHRSRPPPIP